MKIRIKRRRQNEVVVLYIFLVPFLFAMLTELLHLPSLVKYTVDLAWLFILLTMVIKKKYPIPREANILKVWVIAFFIYCVCNYILHYQSLLYFVWGLRNNFRFFVFFLACIYYLNCDTIDDLFIFINKIYYVHIAIVLVQFFFLDYSQDYLGGIFGTQSGCNGWMNAFYVIVVTYSLLRYLNKECSAKSCIINCGMALATAAMAELKFFFAEFIIILILTILLTDFTWKKVGIIVGAILGLILSVNLLLSVFPQWIGAMSVQGFLSIAASDAGYTTSGDMNRLTFMSMSNDLYLRTPFQKLFGLGLGNCDYSDAISLLTTSFYKENRWTHYTWFSLAFMYLENGLIGLIFYIGFFVISFFSIRGYVKKHGNSVYSCLAEIMSIMCIAISFYNSSLRMESGYMLYFILAVPYILSKEGSPRSKRKGENELCN